MAPAPQKCPVPSCEYQTPATLPTYDMVYKDLDLHTRYGHADLQPTQQPQQGGGGGGPKPDRLPRPTVGEGASQSDWVYFKDNWIRYKRSTCLDGQKAIDQLWACCSDELARAVYDSGTGSDCTELALLLAMEKLAVRAQNKLVNVVTFLGMSQDREEPAGGFAARLRGQGAICDFVIDCSDSNCQNKTSYMDHMVAHQLVRGLGDIEIQEQVLGHAATNTDLDLSSITKFIEAKETGKRSTAQIAAAAGLNKLSDYKNRDRAHTLPKTGGDNIAPDGKCGWCNITGHGRRPNRETRESKCKAFNATCRRCSKVGHYESCCRSKGEEGKQNSITQVGSFCEISISNKNGRDIRSLPHYVHDRFKGWVARPPAPHPMVPTTVSLCASGYMELQLPTPRVTSKSVDMQGMTDSGAQMTVAGLNLVHSLGITRRELIPLATKVNAANNSGLGLLGGILITIAGKDKTGSMRKSNQLCYISDVVSTLYLSEQACEDLGIIEEDFPNIGRFPAIGNLATSGTPTRTCSCPTRAPPPPPPTSLPMPATSTNRDKLKAWIEKNYEASAFNQCCHQPLPLITDLPPLQLHADPKAKPVAVHTPVSIPVHWQQQVKEELDRDVRLGVIEPVPLGDPVTWCSRMVVCPKSDGSPRRTVDLQALNDTAVRQTHPSDTPFHLAAAIPSGSVKSVLDCWNGYHSVPLAPEDRHLTTFITPFGRYRYKVAPQGFLAAGDAYTARMALLTAEISNKKQLVDDTCVYNTNLEENFLDTCRFLSICSGAGIVFNKKKFQFGLDEVEFLGFVVKKDSVCPSGKFLDAIRNFPRPRDITGIRSWFGLINQVSYAFSESEIMLPFRNLLKPSTDFIWTQELQNAFEKSKEEITKAVEKGVKTFDMSKVTCLATDWSKQGIGFCLLQKVCNCTTITPVCCTSGWSLVFAGSRFTSGAESRYSPVEGEALGVAWALEKSKHFTLGCPDLYVAVDHKPLLKVLGDRHLEDIPNPRLLNLKEKTLRFKFSLVHVPGSKNNTPDATSRYPTGEGNHMEIANLTMEQNRLSKVFLAGIRTQPELEELESTLEIEQSTSGVAMASLASLSLLSLDTGENTTPSSIHSMSNSKQAITWDRLQTQSAEDKAIPALVQMINEGISEDRERWPENTREFYRVRSELSTIGPVVLYGERVVIPSSLQSEALEILHSAHQGTTGMTTRAMSSVYWPGMLADIARKRAACSSCDKSAPSQPSAPPTPLSHPSYPFELICSDYLTLYGRRFLIVVDRYSGWLSVYDVGKKEGAQGLITALKTHFTTFGISLEVASDGGPEYIATATDKFLKDWGVRHRLSSSYFPHSNQRAELGVKSAKRMLRENVSTNGSLDTDSFKRALLNHRNTPDRDTGVSPAQVIFGRPIRDFLPIKPSLYKPRGEWILTMERRELALARRHVKQEEMLTEHTKVLTNLKVSDVVMVQNQCGPHPLKWDKSGMVVEVLPHNQYKIRMDGTGRVSLRNRKFLKPITPYTTVTRHHPTTTSPLPLTPPVQSTNPVTPHQDPAQESGQQVDGGEEDTLGHEEMENPLREAPPDLIEQEHQATTPIQEDQQQHAPAPRRSGREKRPPRKLQDYDLSRVSHVQKPIQLYKMAVRTHPGGGDS